MAGGLLLLLLNSCITEKKRAEICANCPKETRDSIITEITPFDTTLFITRYGENISIPFLGSYMELIDSLNYRLELANNSIKTSKNGITAEIIKAPGRLIFKCKADSLEYLLRAERKKISKTSVKTITIETPKICPECKLKHKTGFDSFTNYFFWILLLILAIFYAPKAIKFILTSIKQFR